MIDRYGIGEHAGYPTLCKGRFVADGEPYHALEAPTSLNTLNILPEMVKSGIAAVKIEGRQRSPAYVADVTRIWREALDNYQANPDTFSPKPEWLTTLGALSEGNQTTLGAYSRPWQ